MAKFEWNNSTGTKRMGFDEAPAPAIDLMDALGRHGQNDISLDVGQHQHQHQHHQSPINGMSLLSRGQPTHSSVFESHNSNTNLSAGLNRNSASAAAMEYAAMEDIIRQRVLARQFSQVAAHQSRLHSAPFEQRSAALRLGNEEGRSSISAARIATLTGSRDLNASHFTNLARTIPGLPAYPDAINGINGIAKQNQYRKLLPGLYDNGVGVGVGVGANLGLMDLVGARTSMTQEEEILRNLRDTQHLNNLPLSALMNQERGKSNFQQHNHNHIQNRVINNHTHSRISCLHCGRWNFSSHIELLEHESSCSANINCFEGASMLPRECAQNNDALSVDQSLVRAIGQDRVSNIMCRPTGISVEETVRKITNGSSSLPIGSGPCNLNDSQEAASSFQLSKAIPLAMQTDKDWITPLHCFVRRHCVELFAASTSDIFHRSSKGKRRQIHAGRIGIRCPHCHKAEDNLSPGASSRVELNKDSVYFPTTIASIYNATMNLLQRHMHVCENVPEEIMKRYNELKVDDAMSGTSKKYWIESAKALGLVDSLHGIQFSSSASLSVQKNSHPIEIFSTDNGAPLHVASPDSNMMLLQKAGVSSSMVGGESTLFSDIEGGPLVDPEFKYLATAYSYVLLSQMQACVFTETDRLGKRKGLPLGFAGLACRHCYGGYGSGRFFPSNIKTMSDTSKTLNVLHSHMMKCRKGPSRVKVGIQTLRLGHDEERSKMKFGSQKAFFVNIWKRLHGESPLDSRKVSHPKKPSMTAICQTELNLVP